MPAPFAYNWTHSVYILHPFASFLGIKSGPLAVVRPTITNPPISTKLACPPLHRVKTCSNLLTPSSPHAHKGSSFTAWQNLSQVDCDDGALSELADDDHQRGRTARRTRSVCPTGSTW